MEFFEHGLFSLTFKKAYTEMKNWNIEKQRLDWEVSTLGAKGTTTEEKVSESHRLRYTWAIIYKLYSLHSFQGTDKKEVSHLAWKNCSQK